MKRVQKGDDVVVIAGKNKGRRGSVLRVIPKTERVVVQGINMVTKHIKPTKDNPQGGIIKREAAIHISNVMLADPATGDPTRVRIQTLEGGRKVRIAAKSGQQIDK